MIEYVPNIRKYTYNGRITYRDLSYYQPVNKENNGHNKIEHNRIKSLEVRPLRVKHAKQSQS